MEVVEVMAAAVVMVIRRRRKKEKSVATTIRIEHYTFDLHVSTIAIENSIAFNTNTELL